MRPDFETGCPQGEDSKGSSRKGGKEAPSTPAVHFLGLPEGVAGSWGSTTEVPKGTVPTHGQEGEKEGG